MTTLRSILVHLDASPRGVVRLQLGRQLAAEHDASITGLYATTPSALDMPFALAEGAASALPLLLQLDEDRREQARRLFDRSNAAATPRMHWREPPGGEPLIAGVARVALCSDLMLLGQYDSDDVQALGVPPDFVSSLLIASGKPALVVPYTGNFDTIGRNVLIAWKPTREAARAVSCALPLLQRAKRVHVSAELDSDSTSAGTNDLEGYLRLHGVEVNIERHAAVPFDAPGEGLLSLAADVSADLLVMGCYGHSRARELVLGGASRTVLRSMTLPVLMAH